MFKFKPESFFFYNSFNFYLNPVLAEHRSDSQWYGQQRTTVYICRAFYRRQVGFPIGSNLRDGTGKQRDIYSCHISTQLDDVSFSHTDLQEFKSCQHFSSGAVATVDLVVLQLRREARGAIVLVGHLDHGLGKGPAHEVRFALQTHDR